jgi:parvulin-like peptidyl-prolyl isomerase
VSRSRLAVSLVAALLVAGCAGPPLATVEGEAVTLADLAEFNPVHGDGRSPAGDFRADLVALLLIDAIAARAASEFGVAVSDAEVASFVAAPPPQYAALVLDWQRQVTSEQASQGQMDANLASLLVRNEVGRFLASPDRLAVVFGESPELFYSACIRQIRVETEEEAIDVMARLDAGEDFGAVAEEVSIDREFADGLLVDGASGECNIALARFLQNAPSFATTVLGAGVGVLEGPVQSEVGWHALVVEERTGPASVDDLRADPAAFLTDDVLSELMVPWLAEVLAGAAITVDPAIGTWSPADRGIVPPG